MNCLQSPLLLVFFLLLTPVLPRCDVIFYSAYPCQNLISLILSVSGKREEVHASSGQLKAQRCGEGLHVKQICFCNLQHRVKVCVYVCVCGLRSASVCMSQKREFCSCHLLAEVLVIFYKGGYDRGGKGGDVRVLFCPSSDLFC